MLSREFAKPLATVAPRDPHRMETTLVAPGFGPSRALSRAPLCPAMRGHAPAMSAATEAVVMLHEQLGRTKKNGFSRCRLAGTLREYLAEHASLSSAFAEDEHVGNLASVAEVTVSDTGAHELSDPASVYTLDTLDNTLGDLCTVASPLHVHVKYKVEKIPAKGSVASAFDALMDGQRAAQSTKVRARKLVAEMTFTEKTNLFHGSCGGYTGNVW